MHPRNPTIVLLMLSSVASGACSGVDPAPEPETVAEEARSPDELPCGADTVAQFTSETGSRITLCVLEDGTSIVGESAPLGTESIWENTDLHGAPLLDLFLAWAPSDLPVPSRLLDTLDAGIDTAPMAWTPPDPQITAQVPKLASHMCSQSTFENTICSTNVPTGLACSCRSGSKRACASYVEGSPYTEHHSCKLQRQWCESQAHYGNDSVSLSTLLGERGNKIHAWQASCNGMTHLRIEKLGQTILSKNVESGTYENWMAWKYKDDTGFRYFGSNISGGNTYYRHAGYVLDWKK